MRKATAVVAIAGTMATAGVIASTPASAITNPRCTASDTTPFRIWTMAGDICYKGAGGVNGKYYTSTRHYSAGTQDAFVWYHIGSSYYSPHIYPGQWYDPNSADTAVTTALWINSRGGCTQPC
ncbi:hypothetical protein [Yinghuangia soli]|uniref:Peptidase inhibitor family I36 n=1 Tax=Yinghuangia soli TaxID=2908204 RepID=A0AA41Q131_9ACTN|nr:hypothetical protein [Yinghuangia soli]MCF2529548.1 hypothetical protein [Yinghuangia soli]